MLNISFSSLSDCAWRHRRSLSYTFYGIIIIWGIISPQISLAQGCQLAVQDSWKQHFPFDLIYPVGTPAPAATDCPTISFWGKTWTVCAVKQVTATVKYLLLARTAIKGLMQL